jgi:hypothetical protein
MNDTENFELRLASAQGANMAGAATHTVTIQDDDAPTIAFTSPSTPVAEASGTSQVLVRVTSRDGLPLTAVTTVSYATVNGTAVGGADFVPAAGVLTFPAGFASGGTLPIPVMVTADALNEDAETFQVVLSNPVNAVVGTPSAHAITIADDDPLPSLYVQHATVPEPTGDGADALVTVVLTAPSGRLVSAGYATSDVTASAGADYVAASGTVTFAPGTTSQTIAVRVLPDMLDEANEAFLVRLSAPVGALLADGEAQGVILDDDGGPQRCTPIASLPFTISASGQYCLVRHLAMDASTGIAIHIDADQVDLDLGGFTLSGRAAGVGTSAHGIYAIDRSSITVRNGAVDGFFVGVGLNDTSPDVSGSGGHRVEGVRAADNTYVGIDVRGRGNVVRDNQVQRTGGTTFFSAGNDTFGLFTRGSSVRVLGNDVSGTRAAAGRRGYGISIVDARAAVVEGNRVEGQSGTNGVGIWLIRSADALALGNAISATTHGLLFDQSSGKYRDNVCAAVTTPYSGGTDAGNNH